MMMLLRQPHKPHRMSLLHRAITSTTSYTRERISHGALLPWTECTRYSTMRSSAVLMGEWTKAEMTRKAHSPAHTQDIQMQAYYPYRQQQQQQQRRGLATQAKKKETSAAKNNAEVGIPVDPAVPYRKTSFNMVQPMLPSHQKMFDPEDVQSPYQQPGKWHPGVKRCGVVALKCGMTADYDSWGRRFPLTMLKLENVQVVQVKPAELNQGALTIQVGAGEAKPKRVRKPQKGHFSRANVEPKIQLVEFKVSPEAVLEPGTEILAQHFMPGQLVDVTAKSTGKGFQGVMKRHNFGGQPASHGVSKAHRSTGSIGQGADPSRVFKGKKMPGRMGGNNTTVQALTVYKIDIKRNLVYVKGAVPGKAGTYVKVRDSIKHTFDQPPPFPTYFPTEQFIEQLEKWHSETYYAPMELQRLSDIGELPRNYEPEPPFELIVPPPETDPFSIPTKGEPEV